MLVPFGGDQMGNTQKLESAGVVLSLDKFTLDVNDLINSKRKYSSSLDENVGDDFLKEWVPAGSRIRFIKANNL
ncbi:unnamed protein product [Rhizophagus irregularis]|uniref:Uncharacterized protein n=1 Tax=Rhizophagus irregularis TaxID=588596 RepID=A0A2I1G0X0_9GLOM|nr:hypothetical protein RhiirA4_453590 [Rhizophagus irregularis]CAB4436795.1 unnamed protein product [Rhizophagus irregularis]